MSIHLNFLYSVIMGLGSERICPSIQTSCPHLLSADMFARDDGIGSESLGLYHDSVCALFWPANGQNSLIYIHLLILKEISSYLICIVLSSLHRGHGSDRKNYVQGESSTARLTFFDH